MVILNCAPIHDPGVAAIDYLARLKLGLNRGGRQLCLANPSIELTQLIELAGLSEFLGAPRPLVEVKRQPEEREKPGRVEEEGDLGDPPI